MISTIKKTMLVDNKVGAFSVMESESEMDFVNNFDKKLHKVKYMRNF